MQSTRIGVLASSSLEAEENAVLFSLKNKAKGYAVEKRDNEIK